MPVEYSTPFSKTSNQNNKFKFINFALPAVGTCLNAPEVCKSVYNKKPLCFAVRPVTNWPFTDKVANMNKGNCIYKQYANLYLSFNKDKNKFCTFLDDVLCPTMLQVFSVYRSENIMAYDSQSQLVQGMNSQNIWNKLVVYYNGNSNDFLPRIKSSHATFNFVDYMIEKISKTKLSRKEVYIRIHYSGDFYSEEYFNDWVKITDFFCEDTKIHFMAYTKEIYCVENWLKNNNRNLINGKNGIHIKLIFSEMSGFGSLDTSQSDIGIFQHLKSQGNIMKYTVTSKKSNMKSTCQINNNKKCGDTCFACYGNDFDDRIVKVF